MTDRLASFVVGLVLIGPAAFVASSDSQSYNVLPDPSLTPGAVAETRASVICQPGYARAHRVWHDKANTLAKYGISQDQSSQVEDDDLIPVCLGGDNASPKNHWPQQWQGQWNATVKDDLEWRVCREDCELRDDTKIIHDQQEFRTNWITLWKERIGDRH